MRTFYIESWIDLRRSTAGRRGHSARKVKAATSDPKLIALCDRVITLDDALLTRQREYIRGRDTQTDALWTPEIIGADVTTDALVTELRNLVAAIGLRPRGARAAAAKALYEKYFAQGVAYFTNAPIEDGVARVRELLTSLAADAELVKTATVEETVAELVEAHAHLAKLVEAHSIGERVDVASLKRDALTNHRELLELVAYVFSSTREVGDEAERLTARKVLLTSIAEQDAHIAEQLRLRKPLKDIDPVTGDPEPD